MKIAAYQLDSPIEVFYRGYRKEQSQPCKIICERRDFQHKNYKEFLHLMRNAQQSLFSIVPTLFIINSYMPVTVSCSSFSIIIIEFIYTILRGEPEEKSLFNFPCTFLLFPLLHIHLQPPPDYLHGLVKSLISLKIASRFLSYDNLRLKRFSDWHFSLLRHLPETFCLLFRHRLQLIIRHCLRTSA